MPARPWNRKALIIGLAVVLVLAGLLGLTLKAGTLNRHRPFSSRVSVATAFYPLYAFASKVGGDAVEVTNITPAGSEPHDYEPTPKDLVSIDHAKLFIYNGPSFQTWAEKIASDRKTKNAMSLDVSTGIPLLSAEPEPGTPAGENSTDPHFWLDPVLAQTEVDSITQSLIALSPKDREYFTRNAASYKTELAALDAEFKQGLANCQRRDVVTSHQAFGYLAKRYNLNILAISGISPDEEPPPQKLAEVATFARAHNVKYIFFETLVSPKLSETIAREIGAQTLVFNPLEGLTKEELDQQQDYISVQKENLANLKTALQCS